MRKRRACAGVVIIMRLEREREGERAIEVRSTRASARNMFVIGRERERGREIKPLSRVIYRLECKFGLVNFRARSLGL